MLIPYERFVECRERRLRIAEELTQREEHRTFEGELVPADPTAERRAPGEVQAAVAVTSAE